MVAIAAVLMMMLPSYNNSSSSMGHYTVLLPNPDDCSTFFSCSNGVPILMHCPDGLHFNAELDVCDWPANVRCQTTKGTLMGNQKGDTFCCCPGENSCGAASCSTINVTCPR